MRLLFFLLFLLVNGTFIAQAEFNYRGFTEKMCCPDFHGRGYVNSGDSIAGDYIAQKIMTKTDIECRVTTLGHVQRGAPPTASDRILASAFGVYAVDLINQKKFDRMVAWQNRKVVDVPIDQGISTYKNVERKDSLVETALSLDIYIGDKI